MKRSPSTHLDRQAFLSLLREMILREEHIPGPLGKWIEDALWCHYEQLVAWNRKVSLVGPGAWDELLARHYGESLAASGWVRDSDRRLLDIGSGGGFPGMILAMAFREREDRDASTRSGSVPGQGPRELAGCSSGRSRAGVDDGGLEVTLVEPREKKWAFLSTVARKAGLSCRVLNARVGSPLPAALEESESFDIVTSRALVISPEIFRAIARHSPSARFIFWRGRDSIEPPEGYVRGRSLDLSTGEHRRLVEIVPVSSPRKHDLRDPGTPTLGT